VYNESWADKGTAAAYKDADFPYFIQYGSNSTNARSEDGNNPKPESKNLYSARIDLEAKGQILDPMFQVPCTGSYLKFEPKTNGTITARVYQNGAFTDKSGKYQYRPQSRVFVLDEAGKLIQSTPKLAVTTGKAPHIVNKAEKELKDYTWNLQKSDSDIPCTEDMVKSHFGLSSFSFDDPNAVCECLLSQEIVQLENNVTAFSGAKGWVVMYPAPVRYTFNVKAGKTYYLYNFGSKIGFYGASFTPDEDIVEDEVTYSGDKSTTNNLSATSEGHVAKVNIADRTFKAGMWNAGVLPFSLNEQQVDAIFGTTYKKGSDSGTQIVYFEDVNEATYTINFTRHAYNTIVAGKPFLIKPTKDAVISSDNMGEFPYVTIENTSSPELWGREGNFLWKSDYNKMSVKYGSYYISTTDGTVKHYVPSSGTSKTTTMNGFRGFLEPQNEAAMKAKVMNVAIKNSLEDETPTEIMQVYIENDGSMTPISDGKIYNINGQVVGEHAKDLNTLPKGVYILNGKKYFIK